LAGGFAIKPSVDWKPATKPAVKQKPPDPTKEKRYNTIIGKAHNGRGPKLIRDNAEAAKQNPDLKSIGGAYTRKWTVNVPFASAPGNLLGMDSAK